MSSHSRYGTRRLARARRGNRNSAERGIGRDIDDDDDVRAAIWNNGYEVLPLASVRQPSDEIDKRMRFAISSGALDHNTLSHLQGRCQPFGAGGQSQICGK